MTAANDQTLQGTTRERLLDEYGKAPGGVARAATRPYKSRLPFRYRVANAIPTPAAAAVVAFAILDKGQSKDFFGFGIQSNQLAWTPTFNKVVSLADTNQTTGHATNGVEDFCIESISCSLGGVRVEYPAANVPASVTDADAVAAIQGQRQIIDPGNLLAQPQLTSPFNLEVPLFRGARSNISINFLWDNKNQIQIGTFDQLPEGAGQSFLVANGNPDVNNRYKVPEGYAWRAKSRTDGDFVVRAIVEDTVVAPINLVPIMNLVPGTNDIPNALYVDVITRVHGVGFTMIGSNA